MTDQGPRLNPTQEVVLGWLIIVCLGCFFAAIIIGWLYGFSGNLGNEAGRELIIQHFPAIVGLPAAGAGAFVIVMIFKQIDGPIQIEAFTIKFKGAAGPVILWAICFSVIATSVKLLR